MGNVRIDSHSMALVSWGYGIKPMTTAMTTMNTTVVSPCAIIPPQK